MSSGRQSGWAQTALRPLPLELGRLGRRMSATPIDRRSRGSGWIPLAVRWFLPQRTPSRRRAASVSARRSRYSLGSSGYCCRHTRRREREAARPATPRPHRSSSGLGRVKGECVACSVSPGGSIELLTSSVVSATIGSDLHSGPDAQSA